VDVLGEVEDGEYRSLYLTFMTMDGEEIEVDDCIKLLVKPKGHELGSPVLPPECRDEPITAVSLAGAHPNPFSTQTSVSFALPRAAHVSLEIYDLAGRSVRTLENREMTAGVHAVTWDGKDGSGAPLAAGVYFCRLIADGVTDSSKVIRIE
jgi:hypothetical protein